LHNQLNTVAKEKHDLTEEAQRLITTIRQMERAIDDTKHDDEYETEQDVTYPLLACIQTLKEKHHTVAKLHRERFEQVKKLAEALESYASHLEPSFLQVKLPPTDPNAKLAPTFDLGPSYVASLDTEFTRVYDEYNRRVAIVQQTADGIINLWSELGTPQAQVDSRIVQFARDSPEQLGLHQDDMKRLAARKDKLLSEKSARERKLKDLKTSVEGLWDRLGVEEPERKQFLAANRGCGLRQINEFEDELSRLNELKHQNLHLFVEDARFKLQELWDSLYFAEEEMLEFAPAFSDVYSDALLSAHEQEISRLESLKEQRAPILAVIDKHRSLIKDREDLEKSSQDASRLMAKGQKGERRDPGKLLREEKQRKRITKELPKVEADLRKTLEDWEDEYGRPFCVHGRRYLDELDARAAMALPPRSKTPSALPPSRDGAKSASRVPPPQNKASTMRGAPPTRSKTPNASEYRSKTPVASEHRSKTPTAGMQRSNPMTASTFGSSVMGPPTSSRPTHSRSNSALPKLSSPSKIPGGSRLPMGNLRDGNNSPARTLRHAQAKSEDFNATIRGQGAPPRAPPPKMKDIFVPPTPSPINYESEPYELERSASVLRHHAPEDPYDDSASYRSFMSSSTMGPPSRPAHHRSHESYASSASTFSRPASSRQEHPRAPPSRQSSNNSSVVNGGSGSENWETYTDASDNEESDATQAYYARQRALQKQSVRGGAPILVGGASVKRAMQSPNPKGGMGKKTRDTFNDVDGSEAGWTDDGDVGEIY
jgi:protein regulator of cytokinesis 1